MIFFSQTVSLGENWQQLGFKSNFASEFCVPIGITFFGYIFPLDALKELLTTLYQQQKIAIFFIDGFLNTLYL